jgi:hypothetical protein
MLSGLANRAVRSDVVMPIHRTYRFEGRRK